MPDRTAVVVSAVFASFLAGVALTTVSGSADDCIAEPRRVWQHPSSAIRALVVPHCACK